MFYSWTKKRQTKGRCGDLVVDTHLLRTKKWLETVLLATFCEGFAANNVAKLLLKKKQQLYMYESRVFFL